jgi:MFS family permease
MTPLCLGGAVSDVILVVKAIIAAAGVSYVGYLVWGAVTRRPMQNPEAQRLERRRLWSILIALASVLAVLVAGQLNAAPWIVLVFVVIAFGGALFFLLTNVLIGWRSGKRRP